MVSPRTIASLALIGALSWPGADAMSSAADGAMRAKAKIRRSSDYLAVELSSNSGNKTKDSASAGSAMKRDFPFYHTSAELKEEVTRLQGACGGALNVTTAEDSGVAIDVLRVRKPGAAPRNRVFLLFGEHSRELISPESGLRFLRVLCGDAQPSPPESLLQDSEFQIVLNGNPRSRTKVEEGHYCTRTNPSGVDLNRNWDEKWEAKAGVDKGNTQPGPRPFSEPETRIFKDLVTEFRPTTFLTVHSGTRGMYMPWAYDTHHLANFNRKSMMSILKKLDTDHCKCPYGAAGKEVGYACPGTCLDWVYDRLKTPYVFAFEIYTSDEREDSLRSRWEDKLRHGGAALLESNAHLAHKHFRDVFSDFGSDFVHTKGSDANKWDVDDDSCMDMFNPTSKEDYEKEVNNWAAVYIEMAQQVVEDMRTRNITSLGDMNATGA